MLDGIGNSQSGAVRRSYAITLRSRIARRCLLDRGSRYVFFLAFLIAVGLSVRNGPRAVWLAAVTARPGLRIESSAGVTDVARHTDRQAIRRRCSKYESSQKVNC